MGFFPLAVGGGVGRGDVFIDMAPSVIIVTILLEFTLKVVQRERYHYPIVVSIKNYFKNNIKFVVIYFKSLLESCG